MNKVFDSYGKYYDIIYADKDYEKECDFLELIFQRHSNFQPTSILDGGCGTGGHAIPLAKRGYRVTGVDLSDEMVSIAKDKARKSGIKADFNVMDLRGLRLNEKFDAAICMFAVVSYLTEDNGLMEALQSIRKHLRDKALLIFDFWYAPAVLTIWPTSKMKAIEKEGVKVVRFAEPHLNPSRHLCDVDYYFLVMKKNSVLYEGKETHTVRFYFPEEIKHFLEKSGFQLLRICPFLELEGTAYERTWNVTAIAQAV